MNEVSADLEREYEVRFGVDIIGYESRTSFMTV